jgi:hypothetical protein
LESTNWSGYVLPSSTSVFTAVIGQWVVPTLNCSDTPNNNSSSWVGTGGVTWPTGGISGQLLQTGTEDDCVNGVQEDYGWWELYPDNPQQAFSYFPVVAGNSMEATVAYVNGQWVTDLENLSTGLSGLSVIGGASGVFNTATSVTVGPIQGETTGWSYSGAYSAEWIVEDTGNASGQPLPFANYGSVTFSNLRTDLSSWTLPNSDAYEIVQNGVTLSVPGPVINGGFTVNYWGP